MLVNHVLLVVVLLLLVAFVSRGRPLHWGEVAGAIAVLAFYYPLLHAVELNQAMVLVTVLLGAVWLALQAGRLELGGVLLACAFVIKPQLVLLLPLLLWHARRLVWWCLGAAAVLFGLSLVYGGIDNHVEYVTQVLPQLSRGYAYYANQSLSGFFDRLFYAGDIGVFLLPPRSAPAQLLSLACSLSLYAAAIWLVWRWRNRLDLALWVFALAWLVVTLISPIAWQHHFAPALFVFALIYRLLREEPGYRQQQLVLPGVLAFVALGFYFEVRQVTGVFARLGVSYRLYGALVLLGLLVAIIERRGRSAAPLAAPHRSAPR